MSWNLIVTGCAVLLLAYLIWNETRRENRLRLPARLVASVLMTAALAAIALPLTYPRKGAGTSQTAVILTEGYERDSVLRFLSGFGKQPPVYLLGRMNRLPASIRYQPIDDPDTLQALLQKHQPAHVFGWGFREEDLTSKRSSGMIFHPGPVPAGVTAIHWTGSLKKGDDLRVQGRFQNTGSKPVKLLLTGLQATLDSVMVGAHADTLFSLETIPKFAGKALYGLVAVTEKDTLEKEVIPVQVDSAAAIRILMLASSPDFENKFLKSWLAEHGYEVAVRTRITTNQYNRLYVNGDQKTLEHLTAPMLQKFDLLISDPASLVLLQPSELQTITGQVTRNGLGLIVRADTLLPRSFFAGSFPLEASTDSSRRKVALFMNEPSADTLEWLAEDPLWIRPKPETQPLAWNTREQTVVSNTLTGRGKVVLSTLNNSYSWLLAGKEKQYAAFWSLLIRKALQQADEAESWEIMPALPVAGKPVEVRLQSEQDAAVSGTVSDHTVAWARDPQLPFEWHARFWPVEGWQTAGTAAGEHDWYAWGNGHWKPMEAARRGERTRAFITAREGIQKDPVPAMKSSQVPVPKILFFALFLLGAVYLWIEKKFM